MSLNAITKLVGAVFCAAGMLYGSAVAISFTLLHNIPALKPLGNVVRVNGDLEMHLFGGLLRFTDVQLPVSTAIAAVLLSGVVFYTVVMRPKKQLQPAN